MTKLIIKSLKIILIVILYLSTALHANNDLIPRDQLIDDIRQLAMVLESSHPDPYIKGGGKIAFHRRMHKLMRTVPEEGMTRDAFQKLLLPFVASVGDGHTRIHIKYEKDELKPGGIPLYFDIIENSLYVSGVYNEDHKNLIGSILISVNNIPIPQLCERVEKLRGTDNKFGALVQLSARHYLYYRSQMKDLIPEWNGGTINIELRTPSGEVKRVTFEQESGERLKKIVIPSEVMLPSTEKKEFAWTFMDKKGRTAILKVDGMYGFRENFELVGLDSEYSLKGARSVYRSVNGKEPPDDKKKLLHGIPSAVESFRELVKEMKRKRTETLIIDLRHNGGGNSTMSNFLLYFLYGKEHLIDLISKKTGYEIIKYSDLYFKEVKNGRKSTGNSGFNLSNNDYWFEEFYEEGRFDRVNVKKVTEGFYKKIPTFFREYSSGRYSGYYQPENIIVLTSPWTYSSGYTMMKMLNESGVELVGTPSSQNENCPGWILNYKLKNTGISGWVACKYYVAFSNRLKDGVYQVDHLLKYEKLKEYNFDPNSEVIFALDLNSK